jgi:hypothetical protein
MLDSLGSGKIKRENDEEGPSQNLVYHADFACVAFLQVIDVVTVVPSLAPD